jgi:hypothetical protein
VAGIKYELIVKEDLNLGHGAVAVSMPAGGESIGHRINLATFQDEDGISFAELPTAAEGKGSTYTINDSATKTPGATVTGGGAFFILAWSNGTNWLVVMG